MSQNCEENKVISELYGQKIFKTLNEGGGYQLTQQLEADPRLADELLKIPEVVKALQASFARGETPIIDPISGKQQGVTYRRDDQGRQLQAGRDEY